MGFGDVMKGLSSGLLSLVGAGELYDPMGELRGEVSSATQSLNAMANTHSLVAIETLAEGAQDMYRLMGAKNIEIQTVAQNNNSLILNNMQEENLFLAVLAAAVLIIIFFMLIRKKCC